LRLKILKKLRIASLNPEFNGSLKKYFDFAPACGLWNLDQELIATLASE